MQKVSGKRKAIYDTRVRSNDGTTFRFWQVIKKSQGKKGKRRWEYLICHKCGTPVHKTTIKDIPKSTKSAGASRTTSNQSNRYVPHMQPKSCDQNLYVLSLHDCVQSGYAAVRKMNKVIEIKLGRHTKKNMASRL